MAAAIGAGSGSTRGCSGSGGGVIIRPAAIKTTAPKNIAN
jgi:hypothetical protein